MGNFCYRCMQATMQNGVCTKCGEPEASPTSNGENALAPGTTLAKGRLTVGKKLGSGGFGVTYIAYDNNLKRRVALKEFMPNYLAVRQGNRIVPKSGQEQAYQKSMNSFKKEARTLYELRAHPNIVHVISVFNENGTAFYTMEMLEGESFLNYLRRKKKISANRAFQMLLPIMRAIQYVHTKKMIHRDISPDNIMLCEDPSRPGSVVPKLIDFGAAHVAIEGFSLSYPGVKKNGFSPLEQNWEGNSQGPWTDVYSFCATFYSAIVGTVPVAAQTRAESDRDPMKPPHELGADITPAMESVLMRGLAIQYAQRIQTMDQLIHEMSDAVENNQNSTVMEVSRQPVFAEPTRPTVRRLFAWLLEAALFAGAIYGTSQSDLIPQLGLTGDPLILSVLIVPAVFFLLDLILLVSAGSTIGQLFFGVKVREEDGEGSPHFGSALAYALFYCSYGIPIGMLLGFIWLASGKNIGPLEKLTAVTVGRRYETKIQAHGMSGIVSQIVRHDLDNTVNPPRPRPEPAAQPAPRAPGPASSGNVQAHRSPVPATGTKPQPEQRPRSGQKSQPAPQAPRPASSGNAQVRRPSVPAAGTKPQPEQRPRSAQKSQPEPVQRSAANFVPHGTAPEKPQSAPRKTSSAILFCTKAAETAAELQGKAVAVRDGSTLGKNAQKAGIVIPDKTVSGLHCSFRFVAGKGWMIKDEESTNGTYINGVRLPPGGTTPLQNGTVIITGKETFEFKC